MAESRESQNTNRGWFAVSLLTVAFCGFFWLGFWTANQAIEADAAFSATKATPKLAPTSPEIPLLERL